MRCAFTRDCASTSATLISLLSWLQLFLHCDWVYPGAKLRRLWLPSLQRPTTARKAQSENAPELKPSHLRQLHLSSTTSAITSTSTILFNLVIARLATPLLNDDEDEGDEEEADIRGVAVTVNSATWQSPPPPPGRFCQASLPPALVAPLSGPDVPFSTCNAVWLAETCQGQKRAFLLFLFSFVPSCAS